MQNKIIPPYEFVMIYVVYLIGDVPVKREWSKSFEKYYRMRKDWGINEKSI